MYRNIVQTFTFSKSLHDACRWISSDSKTLFHYKNFADSKSSKWNSVLEFFQDCINVHQSTPLVILLNIFSDKLWRRFSFIPRQRDCSKRFIWLLEFCFSIIPVNFIWTSATLFTPLGEFIISIWRNFTQCLFSRTLRKRIAKRRWFWLFSSFLWG